MHKEISSTTLVLIPKTHAPRHLGEYRPISLGNFSGKIISKILTKNKLALFRGDKLLTILYWRKN